MGTRIEVAIRPELTDPRGNRFIKRIQDDYGVRLSSVRILDVYHVDKALDEGQQERCRRELFTDPLTQCSSLGPLPGKAFDWIIEIGFLPGVTDNVGNTSREAVEDLLGIGFEPGESIYSAEQILLAGPLTEEQVQRIASIRYNPLIQRAWIQSREDWEQDPLDSRVYAPKVQLAPSGQIDTVSLNVDDEELNRLGKEGILDLGEDGRKAGRGPLALDVPTLKVIRDHFNRLGRDPTDLELESIAQTWSEHCKHNIFAARMDEVDSLYKTYIRGATKAIRERLGSDDWCLSVFRDNSGVIRLNEDWSICYKVETHNSPSALDPYGGAITGIV
ncbi:MAG: phosphoribosylformylglycinamidine synthase, partial [Thermodesulfobacteriota bacterium]